MGSVADGASRLPNDAGLIYKVLGMETEPVRPRFVRSGTWSDDGRRRERPTRVPVALRGGSDDCFDERLVEAARHNPVLRAVDTILRGAGQVMFQDNPVTGLLFIVGIAWGAIAADMPAVAIGAVVGLIVSTATAMLLRVDETSLETGLYGYNGILVGAAVPTFLQNEPLLWVYIVVGAAVSTVSRSRSATS